VLYVFWWMIALANYEQGAVEPTDWMKPPGWTGNYWGPGATRDRAAGQLSPLPVDPAMARWRDWARSVLRDGDIVFRMGDARTLRGMFPLSLFIAKATGSAFSHTGIVAIEDGAPVVYDCSSPSIQRQPFEVWMLDCVGSLGVKRLKPEHRRHIPGVLAYCRKVFEQEVPFDYSFHPDDSALYCLEMTEKAFRSEGLALSEPIRIGDWEHLARYPLAALAIPYCSAYVLDRPINLEQPVFLPGNEHQGTWSSPLLEAVFGPEPKCEWTTPERQPAGAKSPWGDPELLVVVFGEVRRSYAELPVRWLCDFVLPRVQGPLGQPSAVPNRITTNQEIVIPRP
jgi:Permuted papain-like amidase enzyme, YaeF/YiiX, C92 family